MQRTHYLLRMEWKFKPILLSQGGMHVAVGDVLEAADWLLHRWPADFSRTALHREARMACWAVVEGVGDHEAARAALVSAAREAKIYGGDA